MGKVLNKSYPSDFDPAKIPRRKQPENKQIKVRVVLPINIACGTCGTCMFRGTKLDAHKVGETCLGMQVSRFYFRCTCCSAELSFRTDPQNYSGYTVGYGAGML